MTEIDWLCKFNSLCDKFEDNCRNGNIPAIESFMEGTAPSHQAELLRELLELEMTYRSKRGDLIDGQQYFARFPNHSDIVNIVISKQDDSDTIADATTRFAPDRIKQDDLLDSHRTPILSLGQPSRVSLLPLHSRIGNYELLEEIGRGGMGVVYKARQTHPNRIVALKMILSGEFASQIEINRFRIEAFAVAKLNHPRIVPIHEIGEESGDNSFRWNMSRERTCKKSFGAVPCHLEIATQMILEIAEAIEHAHKNAIIHRISNQETSSLIPTGIQILRILDWLDSGRPTPSHCDGRSFGDAELYFRQNRQEVDLEKWGHRRMSIRLELCSMVVMTGRPPFQGQTTSKH